jgi:exodeoxyribonuclease-3
MNQVQIATWNVNSIKVRLPHVLEWLKSRENDNSAIDALCLQELKLTDDKFPFAELEAAGYLSGKKNYN